MKATPVTPVVTKPAPAVEIDPDVWKLRKALGTQRMQYTTLARKTLIDRNKVVAIVSDPGNGFILSKNGGWVTLAA